MIDLTELAKHAVIGVMSIIMYEIAKWLNKET